MLTTDPVLVICSDLINQEKASDIIQHIGLQHAICSSLTDARALIAHQTFQLILCADDLPDCNLRTSLKVLSTAANDIPVIVISRLDDWDVYMEALRAGAFDYVACPPEPVETERILRLALACKRQPQRTLHTAA
jgi:DNA-binding NtrC family response regulator